MRILYGVTGEGMGHATRSKVVLEHLLGSHAIEVVVSGRAHGFLSRAFPSLKVHEIHGLSMVYEDNRVRKARTAYEVLRGIVHVPENLETMRRIRHDFHPELCIADFESLAYLFAKEHGLPVLSIDNMQIINRCRHSDIEIPDDERGAWRLARAFVKAKLPGCDHYFITTFFFPEVRKKRTSLHPPILRQPILEAKQRAARGEQVLVYQTSDSNTELLPLLRRLPHRFVVYGFKRNEEQGNVVLRDFSEAGFIDDLAGCRAVVSGGGFSLMGEAIYLGKPMYSIPLRGQFEQTLNALYLEKLGYGEHHEQLTAKSLDRFLSREAEYAATLAAWRQEGNHHLLAALDDKIAEIQQHGRLV